MTADRARKQAKQAERDIAKGHYRGPLTWTVEDCAILLQAIAGFDARDAGSIEHPLPDYRAALASGIKDMKIGVLRHYWEEDPPAHDDLKRAMDQAVDVFKKLGARVEDCRARPMLDSLDVKVIIAEARPLYEKYNVLLTAGFGPAPRLDAHRTLNFWQRSNVFTPSNVTAGPELVPGAPQPAVHPQGNEPDASNVDNTTRDAALIMARRAGLRLSDEQAAILLEAAPYAPAMAQRIRRDRDRRDEPALVFRFPKK